MEFENKDMTAALSEGSQIDALPEEAEIQELLVEDSLELNRREKNLSAEEYQQFLDSLVAMNKKIIAVKPLETAEGLLVKEVIHCLSDLKSEVLQKRDEALRQSLFIKEKVNLLVNSGKVQIQQDEYRKSEESVNQYAGLLDNIVAEIDSEVNFFQLFLSESLPAQVVAWASEPDDFFAYVKEKTKFIKKYVKSIRKDLNVSFSRYNFGFQAQIKRILHVEAYIRYHEHREEQMRNRATSQDSSKA